MSELKQEFLKRSTTSIFISVVVISLILYSSNLILNIFISILSLALLLEWMSVLKSSNKKRLIFLILFIVLITFNHYFGGLFQPISFITMLGITVWIVVAYQIFLKHGRLSSNFAFINFWIGLLLVTTFCLVCFQLVTGSRIFISSIFFIICAYSLLEEVSLSLALTLIFAIPFALCGDYFFSFLKRKADVKDTGSILPGHGGLLDRLDSHLAAIPMTLFFSLLLHTIGSYF